MEKILYYNVHLVSHVIDADKTVLSKFLSPKYNDTLFYNYSKFGLNKHNAVFDRSGYLPHFLNMDLTAHPMLKKVENYNLSFFEITELRCKQLLATGKPINVLWSGGIDSTYILLMLYYFANDKSQVRIEGTYNSILESGDMFDRKLKHMFRYNINVAAGTDFKYNDDALYVSGMGGNQLFGPTDNMFATGGPAMFHHTLGTKETIYEPYEYNVDPELLEFFDPMIKNSPKPIETVADLRWYCIFNLDWYTALYEHKIVIEKCKAEKIMAFFDTEQFQEWAINTKEPFTKIKGNANTHRWQMREILSNLFGENHYAQNKSKSISSYGMVDPTWLFLLSNGENILA
jgi:hypothetical protein